MKTLFTFAQGYLTKAGIGVGSAVVLIENANAFFNGDQFQSFLVAGQETWSAVALFGSLAVTVWGAFRASIGYAGNTK